MLNFSSRSSGARVETPQESESQFQNLEETGYLINPDKSPTPALKQLLLGVADYIVSAGPCSYDSVH